MTRGSIIVHCKTELKAVWAGYLPALSQSDRELPSATESVPPYNYNRSNPLSNDMYGQSYEPPGEAFYYPQRMDDTDNLNEQQELLDDLNEILAADNHYSSNQRNSPESMDIYKPENCQYCNREGPSIGHCKSPSIDSIVPSTSSCTSRRASTSSSASRKGSYRQTRCINNRSCSSDDEGFFPVTISPSSTPPEQVSFWMYNRMSKGPRGKSFDISFDATSDELVDPVFDESHKEDVRHVGRARKGDGNDFEPKPEVLLQLGNELEELNKQMAQLGDSKADRRQKTRLASKTCRLKRRAQHEANKIMLAGLRDEADQLTETIANLQEELAKTRSPSKNLLAVYQTLESNIEKVAGRKAQYVDQVLEELSSQKQSTSS